MRKLEREVNGEKKRGRRKRTKDINHEMNKHHYCVI
jgi:hypothetical protein